MQSLFSFLYKSVIQYSSAKLILQFTQRQRAVSVQIVKDADTAAVMSELRKNYGLVAGKDARGASDTAILQQYVKLMYNVRVGLVLLLLRKDEGAVLNDIRSLPLLTVIEKIKTFIFGPIGDGFGCGGTREQ